VIPGPAVSGWGIYEHTRAGTGLGKGEDKEKEKSVTGIQAYKNTKFSFSGTLLRKPGKEQIQDYERTLRETKISKVSRAHAADVRGQPIARKKNWEERKYMMVLSSESQGNVRTMLSLRKGAGKDLEEKRKEKRIQGNS